MWLRGGGGGGGQRKDKARAGAQASSHAAVVEITKTFGGRVGCDVAPH